MRVLIVEDEETISESIRHYLQSKSLRCDVVTDFLSAIEKISLNEYSCIVLDILLPGGSGLNILREIKKNNIDTGVLIISAKNSIEDKVNGLEIGADDYLAKPFHLAELKARVDAIIRRNLFNGKNHLTVENLKINIEGRTIMSGEREINLTPKEFDLLLYFIVNKNKVITKEAIVHYLWGNEVEMILNFDFVYTHIKNIRKKLIEGGCPDYLKAIYGIGYKFSIGY